MKVGLCDLYTPKWTTDVGNKDLVRLRSAPLIVATIPYAGQDGVRSSSG